MRSGGRLKLFLVELSKGMLQLVKPFLLGVSDRPQPQEAVLAHDVAKAMASLAELLGALSSVKNEHDLGQQLVVEREQRHAAPAVFFCEITVAHKNHLGKIPRPPVPWRHTVEGAGTRKSPTWGICCLREILGDLSFQHCEGPTVSLGS